MEIIKTEAEINEILTEKQKLSETNMPLKRSVKLANFYQDEQKAKKVQITKLVIK